MIDEQKSRRSFWALILTQFQGAFSLNAFENLLLFLVLGMGITHDRRDQLVGIVPLFLSIPLVLFSMAGGFLADRFSKRQVTIATKLVEIAAMLLAVLAFAAGSFPLQLAVLFLMATQAAVFGPSKYGLLPEILPQKRLSWGNGIIELGTFLAAITGTVVGARLSEVFAGREYYSGIFFLACSIIGLATSFGISKIPAADPAKKFRANFLGDLWTQGKLISQDRVLLLAVLGNTYFFFLGALLQFDIVFYPRDVLLFTPTPARLLHAPIPTVIRLARLAAGYLSGGKIEYGLIPLGAAGITLFGFLLSAPGLSFNTVLAFLAALGFSGGFFIVPISALIHHRPEQQHPGRRLATAKLYSFIGILGASR